MNNKNHQFKNADTIFTLLSAAWTIEIMVALHKHTTLRFGVIKDEVNGISGRVLAVRLKALEENGFVTRYSHPTSPPQVDYTLSKKGQQLYQFIEESDQKAAVLLS